MTTKLNKEELIELVKKIINSEGSEEEINNWIDILEQNVPDPEISDLIFYPEKEMTPEEIIEKALSYKPIQL